MSKSLLITDFLLRCMHCMKCSLFLLPFSPIPVESFPFPVEYLIPIPILSRRLYSHSHSHCQQSLHLKYLKAEKCVYSVMPSKRKLPSWQFTPKALFVPFPFPFPCTPLLTTNAIRQHQWMLRINSAIKIRTNLMCCRTWSASLRCCCCCCWLISRIPEWPTDRRFTSGCWCPPYVQHTKLSFTKYWQHINDNNKLTHKEKQEKRQFIVYASNDAS